MIAAILADSHSVQFGWLTLRPTEGRQPLGTVLHSLHKLSRPKQLQ